MADLLKYGAKGPEVENLQEALNYHLFDLAPALKVDGKFGDKTHARVFAFQRRRGLGQDGVVGPETRDALYDFIRNRVHILGLHGPESLQLPRPRTLQTVGQDEPAPRFPKLTFPRLELPFPQPVKPPHFFPIPQLMLGGQTFDFELTAGAQRTFTFFSSDPNDKKLKHTIFSDLELVVWRRPAGKYVELSFGPGMWLEKVLGGPDPKTSIHAGLFLSAEFAVPKKVSSSVDFVGKLIADAKAQGSVKGPVELSSEVSIGANPVLEVRDFLFFKKLEFGPKASVFLEIGYEDKDVAVKAGAVVEGALTGHF
ncbi:MAG: hypothetical protein DCC67_07700 [Planctomycetota bacterium]|nr:MAG: hypothetical protein DCC67_07700 [Planctomycetota bacterium]